MARLKTKLAFGPLALDSDPHPRRTQENWSEDRTLMLHGMINQYTTLSSRPVITASVSGSLDERVLWDEY